tara:strand:- start:2981 stop:3343 length:363 start_codon:yes stop_codon:yes gene_type:complete
MNLIVAFSSAIAVNVAKARRTVMSPAIIILSRIFTPCILLIEKNLHNLDKLSKVVQRSLTLNVGAFLMKINNLINKNLSAYLASIESLRYDVARYKHETFFTKLIGYNNYSNFLEFANKK